MTNIGQVRPVNLKPVSSVIPPSIFPCQQLLTFLLLFLSVSSQLDEDARQRFEQILADFGFSQTSRATVRDPNRQKAFASDPQVGYGGQNRLNSLRPDSLEDSCKEFSTLAASSASC